jgi:hypothetical protein
MESTLWPEVRMDMVRGDNIMEPFVHALFPKRETAMKATLDLIDASFDPRQIGVFVMNQRRQVEQLVVQRRTIVKAGAVLGAIIGAAAGLLILASYGLISVASPFGVFEGLVTGGAMGALAGTLGGLGYWWYTIDFPAGAFEPGAVLIGVATDRGRVAEARRVLKWAGARRTYVCAKRVAERALASAVGERQLHAIDQADRNPA